MTLDADELRERGQRRVSLRLPLSTMDDLREAVRVMAAPRVSVPERAMLAGEVLDYLSDYQRAVASVIQQAQEAKVAG